MSERAALAVSAVCAAVCVALGLHAVSGLLGTAAAELVGAGVFGYAAFVTSTIARPLGARDEAPASDEPAVPLRSVS